MLSIWCTDCNNGRRMGLVSAEGVSIGACGICLLALETVRIGLLILNTNTYFFTWHSTSHFGKTVQQCCWYPAVWRVDGIDSVGDEDPLVTMKSVKIQLLTGS
jgi:hypothetical protein